MKPKKMGMPRSNTECFWYVVTILCCCTFVNITVFLRNHGTFENHAPLPGQYDKRKREWHELPHRSPMAMVAMHRAARSTTPPPGALNYFRKRHYIINNITFTYPINEPHFCKRTAPETWGKLQVLILVHSHHAQWKRRKAIRDSWGRYVARHDKLKQYGVRVLFLFGVSPNAEDNDIIQEESEIFHDVIQGDFREEYNGNLTRKTLMGLQWAKQFCSHALFIVKVDNAIMINMPYLLTITRTLNHTQVLTGALVPNSPVHRGGRWEVSFRDYPLQTYPPYLQGTMYLMSRDVAGELLGAAPHIPLLPLEDVHVTGILARVAGLRPTRHRAFPGRVTRLGEAAGLFDCTYVAIHGVTPDDADDLWANIIKSDCYKTYL